MVSDWSEEEVALRVVRVVCRLRKEKEMVGLEEVMREVGVWREREEREERERDCEIRVPKKHLWILFGNYVHAAKKTVDVSGDDAEKRDACY